LMADEKGGLPMMTVLNQLWDTSQKMTLLIGPEGGFENAESEGLRIAGAYSVGLGGSLLRTPVACQLMVGAVRLIEAQMPSSGEME
jgi:16S rRNA (uracil1498-N3)-methyltransferase